MQRALIVGAGASGFLHALALRSAGVAIATVFDPDAASARHLTDLVGGVPCGAFADALASEAEVAAVCSPPIHHAEQAIALARSGRLVFVEKPVALSETELDQLRQHPRVVPILQWRAGRSAHELRVALAAGIFGPRPRVRCDLRLQRDAAYFARRDRARWGCGAMLSIGIHAIDLVLWILDRRVASSRGSERFGRSDVDVPTAGTLELGFEGGAQATVAITLDAPGPDRVHLVVEGASTSAWLSTHEHDPTTMPLSWRGVRPTLDGASIAGATAGPLLVPFIHDALARPSVSIDDVAEAHRLAFALEPPHERRALSGAS